LHKEPHKGNYLALICGCSSL